MTNETQTHVEKCRPRHGARSVKNERSYVFSFPKTTRDGTTDVLNFESGFGLDNTVWQPGNLGSAHFCRRFPLFSLPRVCVVAVLHMCFALVLALRFVFSVLHPNP